MTFVIPFDGSELAESALVRASEFGSALDEPLVAVTVVPDGNAEYAREREWIDPGEPFDLEAVVAAIRDRVQEIAPEAEFRSVTVDRYAPSGTIANRVRRVAKEESASMVFVGSENAGHMVTALGSVGGTVAADSNYDVLIVRATEPAALPGLEGA